jgi:hypothetical protein
MSMTELLIAWSAESDTAEMEVYLSRILQVLRVLGVSEFMETVEKTPTSEALYREIKWLATKGRRTSGGFLILEGSEGVAEHIIESCSPSAAAATVK